MAIVDDYEMKRSEVPRSWLGLIEDIEIQNPDLYNDNEFYEIIDEEED